MSLLPRLDRQAREELLLKLQDDQSHSNGSGSCRNAAAAIAEDVEVILDMHGDNVNLRIKPN
jgi:hypothetical protein